METPRLVDWQTKFINKIRKFRTQNRNIVYLHEICYDNHDVLTCWVDHSRRYRLDTPVGRGKRAVILAAKNIHEFIESSFVISTKNIRDNSANYHDDINHQVFEN